MNIAFYGSHNATFVVEENGKILEVLEMERFLNFKNVGMAQYMCPRYNLIVYLAKYMAGHIMRKYNVQKFDTCFYMNTDVITTDRYHLDQFIPANKYVYGLHHQSHAAGGFYQSPYSEALIFSVDGGANDGKFNIYTCKRGQSPVLLQRVMNPYDQVQEYDLGYPYMFFGEFLGDIKYESLTIGNLVYPGKIMGLASYGSVVKEWLPFFIDFYKKNPGGVFAPDSQVNQYTMINDIIGRYIGVVFDINNRLYGEIAYNVAATSQAAFESCFFEVTQPYIDQYPEMPLVFVGGCALNILLNTKIREQRDVFIGPNPNDCGIALGMMLNHLKPAWPYDATYSGIELMDASMLFGYLQNSPINYTVQNASRKLVAQDLADGKIIGVARRRSEHGARALGNRSILCDPSYPNMKDVLNAKVKHREWYRPFAPVVRLEDVSKYFHFEGESRWMSFCPVVREEWRDKLASITHIDGTARVQTVTRENNRFLYDLLTQFDKIKGFGVLLNTSFNVDGKPILSSVRDAMTILESTEMDGLIIENVYIKK